jgi:hypothetical protein
MILTLESSTSGGMKNLGFSAGLLVPKTARSYYLTVYLTWSGILGTLSMKPKMLGEPGFQEPLT